MSTLSRWLTRDAVIAIVIAAGGFTLGTRYLETFRATGQPYDFAQTEFGAAVAMACGHGFSEPIGGESAAYAEFLHVKRDAISCADLPRGARFGPPNFSQGLYRYLMETVAVLWRIRGISWSGLWPLFGIAYALTLVATYGLFRLAMNRSISVAGTFLFAVSAVHLGLVVYLRDYAKAPFILALVFVMACIARAGASVRQRLWLSAAFGLVLGIGFGFRNDLLILVPPFAAVVALRVGGLRRRDLMLSAECLAIAAAGFVVAAWPLLVAYTRGSNNGHVILLGFMANFERPLGLSPAMYDWGHNYSDSLVATLVNSYTERTTGASVLYVSRAYDSAMMDYIGEIARHFPADIVTRAYASALKIFELPFAVGAHTNPVPYGIHTQWILNFYGQEGAGLHALAGFGAFIVLAALAIVSASDLAGALLLTALVVYFAGYPAIQFHVRHFFHLELITWWSLGLIVQTLVAAPRALRDPSLAVRARRVAIFLAVTACVLLGPLAVLRIYQNAHARELLAQYRDRPRERLDLVRQARPNGTVLFTAPTLWTRFEQPDAVARRANITVETEYLTAEFSADRCDAIDLSATVRYESKDESTDFSRRMSIPLKSGVGRSTLWLFPAFWNKTWSRFLGIEVAAGDADCFVGLSRTTDLRGLTLALNVLYEPDWQSSQPLHQSIANWERRRDESPLRSKVVPDTLSMRRAYLEGPLSVAAEAALSRSALVNGALAGPLTMRGVPDGPYTYLVEYGIKSVGPDAVFVAEGTIRRGGLTIGLLHNEQWSRATNVVGDGSFRVVIQPPAPGDYKVIIANCLEGTFVNSRLDISSILRRLRLSGPPTDAVISRIGWSEPAAPDR